MPHLIENSLCHSFGVGQDIVVPESQDTIALSLQPACALFVVVKLLYVLATIHFNYHAAFETDKVHDEMTNRLLSPKLHALDLPALELLPETVFCVRQVVAKFSRAFGVHPPS